MTGWKIPPPKRPTKTDEEFRKEREKKVRWLVKHGYLRSERIKNAMLRHLMGGQNSESRKQKTKAPLLTSWLQAPDSWLLKP
jgi:hypothetical protein